MQRLPRGVYTKEFREQAVRLVLEEGLPIPQAGQRLSGVTSRARGSRWARSEMTRAVGTLPGWPGRG